LANIELAGETLEAQQPGDVRAASYDSGSGAPRMWCVVHEREVSLCRRAELACDGEPMRTGDPVGDAAAAAADGVDAASATWRRLEKRSEACEVGMREVRGIVADLAYRPEVKQQADPGPGDVWCRSCWRDGKYQEGIAARYEGLGLCRWCGDRRAELRDRGIPLVGDLPPVALVKAKHRMPTGGRITRQKEDEILRHVGLLAKGRR
jgi:hypothetical protein